MKKYIAALLIAVMLFTLAGCANEEISMYSLISEISQLDIVNSSNTISVSLDEESMGRTLDSIPPEMEELRKTLSSGFEINYTYTLKKEPLEYEATIGLKKKGADEFDKITTIVGNETTTYIKLDDLLKFAKPYISTDDPVLEKTMDDIIKKVSYIKVDLGDLKDNKYDPFYNSGFWKENLQSEKKFQLIDEFIETIKEAFKDFSFDAVTQKDNGYELVLGLGPEDIKPIYIGFIKYIINNIDLIASKLSDKVYSLDDEQMEILGEVIGSKIKKGELISGIENFEEEVKATTPDQIQEIENDEYLDKELMNFEGSQFKYYVGKTGDGYYESTSELIVKYDGEYTTNISANISTGSKTKVLSDFNLVVPLNYTTVEQLEEIIYSTVPIKASKVKVNLNSKNAGVEYNNGREDSLEMQYITKDGYTYLPLRKVGETLGEEVGWDNAKKEAYVVVDGERIVMKGLNMKGQTYVKIRDFEQLGYEIGWDEENREVLIEKSSQYPVLDYLSGRQWE